MSKSHKFPDVKAFDQPIVLEYMDRATDPVVGLAILENFRRER